MGTNYYAVAKKPSVMKPIHIGKSSCGWRFVFHCVPGYFNNISGEPLDSYSRWIRFLQKYTEDNTIVVVNEYDEEITLDQFIELVQRKQLENNKEDEEDFGCFINEVDGYLFEIGEFV